MNRYIILIFTKIIIILLLSCSSKNLKDHEDQNQVIPTTDSNDIKKGFQEDQPVYPVDTDDPFFFKDGLSSEAFRVLITRDNYQIRQISYQEDIEILKDIEGDKVQLKYYNEYYELMSFKDWEFEGILQLRLNPQTANIEKIHYHSNYIPRTKQALELFLQDVSRYKFRYLTEKMNPDTFLIRILWRIEKDPNLTEEEAKQRAIELLKKRIK